MECIVEASQAKPGGTRGAPLGTSPSGPSGWLFGRLLRDDVQCATYRPERMGADPAPSGTVTCVYKFRCVRVILAQGPC